MSFEHQTDLLARYVLCLFERVEQLEKRVVELQKTAVAECEVIEMLVDAVPDMHEPEEAPPPPAYDRRRPRTPLSKRDPAIAERWRQLWSAS